MRSQRGELDCVFFECVPFFSFRFIPEKGTDQSKIYPKARLRARVQIFQRKSTRTTSFATQATGDRLVQKESISATGNLRIVFR